MQPRPVRAKIYEPVIRYGVVSSDWKYVLGITMAGYMIPLFLGLTIMRIPLFLLTGLLSAALSVAFFMYIRVGRRPGWFKHTLRALVENPIRRRALPADRIKNPRRAWLIETPEPSSQPMTAAAHKHSYNRLTDLSNGTDESDTNLLNTPIERVINET